MNFKSLTIGITTGIVALTTLTTPVMANSLIEADNRATDTRIEKARDFINNPIAPRFNESRVGGSTNLIQKCEARRHFQGKGYFFKTKKMSAQIMAEHPVGGMSLNRNEICEHVLSAAGI